MTRKLAFDDCKSSAPCRSGRGLTCFQVATAMSIGALVSGRNDGLLAPLTHGGLMHAGVNDGRHLGTDATSIAAALTHLSVYEPVSKARAVHMAHGGESTMLPRVRRGGAGPRDAGRAASAAQADPFRLRRPTRAFTRLRVHDVPRPTRPESAHQDTAAQEIPSA